MTRRFFSASRLLGSRAGAVGVGVSQCPGAAWVFNRRAPLAAWSLALFVPAGLCPLAAAAAVVSAWGSRGVSVSVRRHHGRAFLRVRGPVSALAGVARWWSAPPRPPASGGWLPPHISLHWPVSPVVAAGLTPALGIAA